MDTAIKQRILGGLVLVAGAAIFLPLMLDGSGAKLLSRLSPIPAKPVVPVIAPDKASQDAQRTETAQAVAGAHDGDTAFYPVGEPASGSIDSPGTTAQPGGNAIPAVPPASIAKSPEQLAAEEAARQRAAQLLASPDGISPEEAAVQQKAADKLVKDITASQKAAAAGANPSTTSAKSLLPDSPKSDGDRAKAILEARNTTDQLSVEEKLRADHLKTEKAAAEKKAADKLKAEQLAAEKTRAAKSLEDDHPAEPVKPAETSVSEKLKTEKLKAEHLAEEKKVAEAKAEAAKKAQASKKKESDEEKAQALLEGKAKTPKETGKESSAGSGWIVQVANLSVRDKADALSAKLHAKGYRSQVVKSGDTWKVVVGPELQKDSANNLRNKLNGEGSLGVSGAWVAPWKP